jgi:hypothetical protein
MTILTVGLTASRTEPDGAPLRLAVPWGVGFGTSSRSSDQVHGETAARPGRNRRRRMQLHSDVNRRSTLRWSQTTRCHPASSCRERVFNGYGDQVAGLYTGWI